MKLFATIAAVLTGILIIGACNKHDVPMGGACEKNEDCGPGALACYKASQADPGYCSQTCVVAPPKGVIPGGPGCDAGGLVCKKAPSAHPILGEEFCVKP
jgi:hypothetical protein